MSADPRKPPLARRPSFWVIVLLVIVIPTVTYCSTQLLLRVLRPPHHAAGIPSRAERPARTGVPARIGAA